MANALLQSGPRRRVAASAGIVLTALAVFLSGCGQRGSPPPETQATAPDQANPLVVESGESPSGIDPASPFNPLSPPAPFPPNPHPGLLPSLDPLAGPPLYNDTAPPADIPPATVPPAFTAELDPPAANTEEPPPTPPESVPPESVPPDSVPPDSVPPDSVPPDSVPPANPSPGVTPPAREIVDNDPPGSPGPTNENFGSFSGNPLRTDSPAAPARTRVNPLRSGSASAMPLRPRPHRASLSDNRPSADAGRRTLGDAESGSTPETFTDAPPGSPPAAAPDVEPTDAPRGDSPAEPQTTPGSAFPPRPPSFPPPSRFPSALAPESAPAASPFTPNRLVPPGAAANPPFAPATLPTAKPDDAAPGNAAPGDAAPSAVVPGDAAPNAVAPGDGATGTTAAGTATTGDFTTVRIFYATDRARLDAFDLRKLSWRPLPWLPVIALGAAALALITGSMLRRWSGRAWLAGGSAALSAALVLVAGSPLYLGQVNLSAFVERLSGTSRVASRVASPRELPADSPPDHAGLADGKTPEDVGVAATGPGKDRLLPSAAAANVYGDGRGELEFGECEVTIPRRHEPGQIERPSLWRLEFHENPDRHVVLRSVERRGDEAFFDAVRNRVAASPRNDLFVFIHGYNVSFEMAARRTAQMAHDLKFEGAPIFYSWPSQGGLLKYPVDETNVAWTVPHLKQFLRQLAARSQARALNVIAHSMGNRALASAIRELSLEHPLEDKRFQQVVLAAPDIDAEVFKRDVAPLMARSAEHVTLYASSRDQALAASKLVHGYPRAGDSGSNLLVIPGIETVDVTEVDTGILGHSYYGNSVPILRDLERIFHGALAADQRPWLQTAERNGQAYWVFHDHSLATRRGAQHR